MKQQKKNILRNEVCDRIRAIAAERGFSNIELAGKADVSYRTIYSVMHGMATPRNRIVGRIAAALGTSGQYLLNGTGKKSIPPEKEQEAGTDHSETGDKMQGPSTIDQAIKLLSVQFRIPEAEILRAITDLTLMRNHKEGCKQ